MKTRNYSQFWLDYGSDRHELHTRFADRDDDQWYETVETPNVYINRKICTDDSYKYDSEFSSSIDTMLNL